MTKDFRVGGNFSGHFSPGFGGSASGSARPASSAGLLGRTLADVVAAGDLEAGVPQGRSYDVRGRAHLRGDGGVDAAGAVGGDLGDASGSAEALDVVAL